MMVTMMQKTILKQPKLNKMGTAITLGALIIIGGIMIAIRVKADKDFNGYGDYEDNYYNEDGEF